MAALKEMKIMEKNLELPAATDFFHRTFEILGLCRQLIHSRERSDLIQTIHRKTADFYRTYPGTYRFNVSCSESVKWSAMSAVLSFVIRKQKGYRWLDRILFNRFTGRVIYALYVLRKSVLPDFADKQTMPLKTLLS